MRHWIVDIIDADDEFIREFRCAAADEAEAQAQAEDELGKHEFVGDAVEISAQPFMKSEGDLGGDAQ